MNGIIEESTLERMGDIRGKPVRRGLDKAINECLDKLEDGTCKDSNPEKVDCLNDNCKEELEKNAS